MAKLIAATMMTEDDNFIVYLKAYDNGNLYAGWEQFGKFDGWVKLPPTPDDKEYRNGNQYAGWEPMMIIDDVEGEPNEGVR